MQKIIAENLKRIRKNKNISQSEMANALDISINAYGNYELGRRIPTAELLNKITQMWGVNGHWLLTGVGDMFKGVNNIETTYELPVRGEVEASLGYGVTVYNEDITSTYSISKKFADDLGINPKRSEIIFARGDSMETTIFGGDSVLIDQSKTTIHDGVIYCIRLDGEPLIKRLQRLSPNKVGIISDNPKYAMREVILNENNVDDFAIIGEVRWWGRIAK